MILINNKGGGVVNRIGSYPGIIALLIAFLILAENSVASSFPFRAVEVGEAFPSTSLLDLQRNEIRSLEQLRGRPVLLLFWGADISTKKERSIAAINELMQMESFFQEHQVEVLLVNTQGDSTAAVQEIRTATGANFPFYQDSSQALYGALGIFVMPSVLLVDHNGLVAAGMGYRHDLADRLREEVQILAGEKTREEVGAELRPEVKEKSAAEKAAQRHLKMSAVMLERGMPEAGIRELEEVLKLTPGVMAVHEELGCLYLSLGDTEKARLHLEKGAELEEPSLQGQICQARLKAEANQTAEAIQDLQGLLLRNGRNPELRYTLGTLYEQQEDLVRAAAEYRKSYELLKKAATP